MNIFSLIQYFKNGISLLNLKNKAYIGTDANGNVIEAPTPGTGNGDMILNAEQSVTGLKNFDKEKLAMKGTDTGKNTISVANASANDYTNTIPAKAGTFAMTDDVKTEFSQLNDVAITNPLTGQLPIYNAITGKWENPTKIKYVDGEIISAEKILNGNFELGTGNAFTSWAITQGGGSTITEDLTGGILSSRCPKIIYDGTNYVELRQSNVATVGKVYRLSFWARSTGGTWRHVLGTSTNFTVGATFTQFTVYTVATSTNLLFSRVLTTAANLWIDNVSVVEYINTTSLNILNEISTLGWLSGVNNIGEGIIQMLDNKAMRFYTNAIERMSISADGDVTVAKQIQAATAKFGDVAAGNYMEVTSTGHIKLYGSATYFVDIDFPVIIRTTGAGIPSLNTFQGNLKAPQWAVNNYYDSDDQEFIHPWKEASQVVWHLHLFTGGTDATDRYYNFEIEYTWANFNAAVPANTVVQSGDLLLPANTPALTHKIYNIATWTPTAGLIGAHIKSRLKRIAATGTAPSADPFISKYQLHVECDTLGSDLITTK